MSADAHTSALDILAGFVVVPAAGYCSVCLARINRFAVTTDDHA